MTLTTVDIENLRELRAYLLESNRTLKFFINESIKEKVAREKGQTKLPIDFGRENGK
jgi:hypothetical protein